MLVFFVLLAFLAEGFCDDAVIETKIKCGENQVPSDCADNYSEVPQITLCRPGCRCIENHTRNSYDECVPTPPPLMCCENEEASTCKQTCPPQDCAWDPTRYACKPGPCQPGCNCKKGRLRDAYGKCIPQERCPPILPRCGDNEEPTDCARNIGPFDSTLTIKCRPCQCIQGYVRDINGLCVLKELQCGKNEEPNICIAIFPSNCPPCRCIANHKRNSLGVCVPDFTQCGKNEEPNDCSIIYPQPIQPFEPSIDVVAAEYVKPVRIRCQPCKCIKGYERNINGVCVSKCNGDENAFYTECPNQCVSTCKNPNAICSQECGEAYGCKCKFGYILSEEGRCVLPEECPGGNPCGLNKTHAPCYVRCPSNDCPKDDSLAIVLCLLPFPCSGGCACQINYKYVSSEDDRCILGSDCAPIKCTRQNEEYNSCPSACFSEGCGSPQLEPKTCNTLVANVCRPRCVCKTDFRRDSSGDCIPKEKCPPQCGENEEPTDCGDIFLPQPLTTDVASESIRIRCQPGCTCISGYTRDRNGVCVLTPQKCTGKNEVMNPCPSACFGDNCGELDEYTAACNTLLPYVCKPRCMCRKDYRRDSNGNCIPKEKCPVIS